MDDGGIVGGGGRFRDVDERTDAARSMALMPAAEEEAEALILLSLFRHDRFIRRSLHSCRTPRRVCRTIRRSIRRSILPPRSTGRSIPRRNGATITRGGRSCQRSRPRWTRRAMMPPTGFYFFVVIVVVVV